MPKRRSCTHNCHTLSVFIPPPPSTHTSMLFVCQPDMPDPISSDEADPLCILVRGISPGRVEDVGLQRMRAKCPKPHKGSKGVPCFRHEIGGVQRVRAGHKLLQPLAPAG